MDYQDWKPVVFSKPVTKEEAIKRGQCVAVKKVSAGNTGVSSDLGHPNILWK